VLLQQPLARQVEQHHGFVMLERSVQQTRAKYRGVRGLGILETETVLDFAKVVGPGVLAVAMPGHCLAVNAQLQRQVCDDSGRRTGEVARDEAQIRSALT
jgi:hypothetical protein